MGVFSIVLVVELMDCLIVYLQGCPEPDSMVPEPVAPEIMVTEPEIQIEEVEVSNEIESEPISGVIDGYYGQFWPKLIIFGFFDNF